MQENAESTRPYDLICDALALAYGTDGAPGSEYWGVGADLIVTTLIEAGWMPPEADAPALIDGT